MSFSKYFQRYVELANFVEILNHLVSYTSINFIFDTAPNIGSRHRTMAIINLIVDLCFINQYKDGRVADGTILPDATPMAIFIHEILAIQLIRLLDETISIHLTSINYCFCFNYYPFTILQTRCSVALNLTIKVISIYHDHSRNWPN